jgi:hypothetical protein
MTREKFSNGEHIETRERELWGTPGFDAIRKT